MIGATVRRRLLVLTMLLGAGRAQAASCDSYDDCVESQDKAVERGDFAAAQAAAEAALRFQQNPVLFVNLGNFHEKQGHKSEALGYYLRYQESGDSTLTPEQRAEVARRIARLRQEWAPPLPPPTVATEIGGGPALLPTRPPPPPSPPIPSWRLRAASIGVGIGGLVLTAVGATLLALDKHWGAADANGSACMTDNAVRDCDYLYRTQRPGIALVAVGGVALVGGVVLFTIDGRRNRGETRLALRFGGTSR